MNKINVAILGLGVVGGGSYDILVKNHDLILNTQGLDINVVKILDRNLDYIEKRTGSKTLGTTNLDDIVTDKSIQIVIETIGGVEPAKTFIEKCLLSGKSIVTANKELLAKHWGDLEAAAKKGNAGLYFEASCVGAVPIIRTLNESMQCNNLAEIMGIINGTTNYILTKMSSEGMSYDDALKGAQKSGFAESNPTADVESFDAAYKLSILASLAFHTCIPYTSIYREGITNISTADIKSGKELGYTLKLIALGRREGNRVEVRVHPAFISDEHPLSAVRNEFNAVFLKGDACDDIMLYGRGAGALPTGSAIVSDVIYCATRNGKHKYSDFENNGKAGGGIVIKTDFSSKYYLAITAADKPGVLSKITDILGKMQVSIKSMFQHDTVKTDYASIVLLTHETGEKSIQAALEQIKLLKEVASVDSLIRVI